MRGAHRQHHGQAAAQQHDRIGRADDTRSGCVLASAKTLGYDDAVDGVRQEHAAEEHDLGDEEDPHPQRGGVLLLRGGIELLAQRERFRRERDLANFDYLPHDGAVVVGFVRDHRHLVEIVRPAAARRSAIPGRWRPTDWRPRPVP